MPSFARLLGRGCWTAVAGHRLLGICCGPIPTGSFFPMPISPLPEHKIGIFVRFCQQVSSRWLPRPATNLIWRRSTPVWLAIWRTWAGFANSQLLPDAAAGAPSRALGAESSAERQLFRWKHLSAR